MNDSGQKGKRRWLGRLILFFVLVLLGLTGWVGLNVAPKSSSKIVDDESTTYLVGKIRHDGFPDYIGARNERRGKGVTPTSNAAVLVVHAVGARTMFPKYPKVLLGQLRISEQSLSREFFHDLIAYLRGPAMRLDEEVAVQVREKFFESFYSGTFKSREHPLVVRWINSHAAQMRLISDASTKPRFYLPWISSQPKIGALVHLSRGLACRAMMSVEKGDMASAVADAQALYRLGHLVASSADSINVYLSAVTIYTFGSSVITYAANSPKFTAEHAQQFRATLPQEEYPATTQVVGFGERLIALSAGISLAHRSAEGTHDIEPHKIEPDQADVNAVLRQINVWYDRMQAACAKKTVEEQRVAATTVRKELTDMFAAVKKRERTFMGRIRYTLMSRRAKSRHLGFLVGNVTLALMLPDVQRINDARAVGVTRAQMARIATALAQYRLKHQKYPASIEDLSPDFLQEIPQDPFSEKPYIYQVRGSRCLIYSVGSNRVDDGGSLDPEEGDIAVELKVEK